MQLYLWKFEVSIMYFLREISNSCEGKKKMAQNVLTRILSFTDGNVRKQTPFETDSVTKCTIKALIQ